MKMVIRVSRYKLFGILFGFLLLGNIVLAIPQNASVSATDLGLWVPNGTAGNWTTQGGYIANATVGAQDQLTDRWAGFYGQVTAANIILAASGDSNYLYEWAGNLSYGGEVCVSIDPAFNWAVVESSTDADIETAWTFGAVLDSAANTFNNTGCAMNFTGRDTAQTNNADWADHQGSSNFRTCVYRDVTSDFIPTANDLAFCCEISDDDTGYDGATVDYELIVPTNDSPGGTETYYFFVELG